MSNEILRLIKGGESETLEFMSGRAQIESVARTVCAFLNQQGGIVLWGVKDNGDVTGVSEGDSLARELYGLLAREMTPSALFSVSSVTASEKTVVVVDVPRGSDKPYSLSREIWVRVGASTLRATADQSVELVRRSVADWNALTIRPIRCLRSGRDWSTRSCIGITRYLEVTCVSRFIRLIW